MNQATEPAHAREAVAPSDIAELLTDPRTAATPEKAHQAFAWLRENQPVSKIVVPDFDPFWIASRHADIMEIERQPDVFHNGDRATVLMQSASIKVVKDVVGSPNMTRSLVSMDGADHRMFRGLTQKWFMPANVKRLSEKLRGIAKIHVDRMFARGGECDFVADVALHYPLHVIMDILGVPEEDEPKMLMLTQQLFGARDPDMGRSAAAMTDPSQGARVFMAVLEDFYAYFGQINADRKKNPRDDLATVIAQAQIDGAPISDSDANAYYVLVATAGHDTTSASTAGAIWGLAERPDQLAKVKADPWLIDGLVDEAIRWVTPVRHFMRSATRDYEIGGVTIRKGEWIMLAYLSANRDEAVFEDPFEFRVDRIPNKQLAFGFGAHVCLGQHLARLEMRCLLEELLPRLDTLELAGEPAWSQSTFVSGPKRLPIRFTGR